MKYFIGLFLFLSLLTPNFLNAEVDKLSELQRTKDYQLKRFYVGRVGLDLSYIVDRTNNLCFALFLPKDRKKGQDVLEVSCDKFKSGPIHQFIKSGTVYTKQRSLIDKITGRKKKVKVNE